ncbi:hypothetical protein [Burkholderia gladioli]|uniref:hypothetical protein n=1 Tax=Burkholderia gladioli TaxID=28095 RepID=UPI00163EF69B|nr:hypothetical protein [Burkholderia gladioli]
MALIGALEKVEISANKNLAVGNAIARPSATGWTLSIATEEFPAIHANCMRC